MGQSTQNRQSWTPHLRPEHRTFSAPTTAQVPVNPTYTGASPRSPHLAAGSVSNSSSPRSYVSKDDSALPSRQPRSDQPLRPLSTANLPSPSINTSSPKPSPNRYRRTPQRAEAAAAPSSPAASPIPTVIVDDFGGPRPARTNAHNRVSSVDDSSHLERVQPERYRRRSLGNMDATAYPNLSLDFPTSTSQSQSGSYDFITFDTNQRPASAHSQRDSVGSVHSTHSSASSAREGTPPESNSVTSKTGKPEEKRTGKPSPLSQPVSTQPEAPKTNPPAETQKKATPPTLDSPAAKRLTDLKNETKRPGKSRLRRAFSFGSASELLKTSAQSNAAKREALAAEQARREALREQLGPEQAAIAEQQELSGLGESIYSHQGHFFTGSTDNLSVSSTASSASMMLRKMGKGVKRSTRSLVGMFRPKSVASINSMEGAGPEVSPPQITVVNVEAERENVAVNPDPADLPRGGTVFPKFEGNADVRRSVSIRERAASENSQSRKSIVGGDRERAEILAAVRKGILKKTHSDLGTSSPAYAFAGGDSPHSSAPPTPDESSKSPAQNDPVKIAGEDYFLSSAGRFSSSEAKSAPITPSAVGRNIVFSPRIQFHETWPSGEYDRRGEIATCNRLTPLLAQQIREEINNFKMEMEVHENSKIYTHFI
ncbi:uncharacterized protein PGRI_031850 [Penicillium griseofulvum]|uniref:Protein BNI4 n=1 Tax=Penicillium patulum TaxID=5078 RepID=A0A135LK11_PENPA|nr:uncharacterized protein PGRI_031850 [Penicillium griseofulvum]KXG49315.1 hypothetical protein PGRI_031850 [Penicillium griseofulvum]